MRDEVLFWKYEWSAVVHAQQEAARKDADRLADSDFEGRDVDEIIAELCEKYSLEPPVLDPENITVKQREIEIDVSHNRRRSWGDDPPHYIKGTAIDVRLPFTGDAGMFNIKPNTWTTSIPRGRVEGNSIVFSVSGTDLSPEKVKSKISGTVSEIQKWLDFQSDSARGFPEALARVVKQAVEARQSKLVADNDLVSNLGFRVE
ncbi:hypothetical protein [Aestuariivita sp.]|jgi:hypothetical protein|uniref:hypothetical protein n=1 Tax=Aestuariivita sp. TaxID=1872407 RepID=UPI00216D349E|nr:hypothetical protein [Aestuariivita sp.]MCE8006836.1 hypothetical protein [Aestuariivita sp.]